MKSGFSLPVYIFIIIAAFAVSWGCTCGIIKLITMCFDLEFSFKIATGVWLIELLAKGVFGNRNSK